MTRRVAVVTGGNRGLGYGACLELARGGLEVWLTARRVRTETGGPTAPRGLDEGVAGIVWAATLADAGPSGGFFRDGAPLSW